MLLLNFLMAQAFILHPVPPEVPRAFICYIVILNFPVMLKTGIITKFILITSCAFHRYIIRVQKCIGLAIFWLVQKLLS